MAITPGCEGEQARLINDYPEEVASEQELEIAQADDPRHALVEHRQIDGIARIRRSKVNCRRSFANRGCVAAAKAEPATRLRAWSSAARRGHKEIDWAGGARRVGR
jgi:hypothetical protein